MRHLAMPAKDTIAAAENLLLGVPAAKGTIDPRWQAVIAVGEYIPTNIEKI